MNCQKSFNIANLVKISVFFFYSTFLVANSTGNYSIQLNRFKNISGNAKIDSFNSVASKLDKSESKLIRAIGWKSYKLSRLNNYNLGLVHSLNNIGMSYFYNSDNDSALLFFNKALFETDSAKWKVEPLINIAEIFSEEHSFDSSLIYYNKALLKLKGIKDSVATAKLYNLIGFTYWRKGDFVKAIKFFKKSLKIRRRLGNPNKIARVLNNIGSAYYQLGNYQLALEYFIEAEDIKEKISEFGSPLLFNSIGGVYLELNDTAQSQYYFNKGLLSAKKTNHRLGLGYSYFSLGDLNFKKKKYKLALEYFSKSKPIYEELNDINGVVKILNRIGQVYLKINEVELAKSQFLDAYNKSKKNGLKLTETISLVNLCRIDIINEKYGKALTGLKGAYKFAKNGKFSKSKLIIYKLLSEVYEKLNRFKTSLTYHKKYTTLKDSLFNKKRVRIVAAVKEKYEADRKEKENNNLRYVNNIQKLRIENQTREKLYIAIASIVFLIIIIYLVYLNIQRKKKNKALIHTKQEIERINQKLNDANKLLEQSNSAKDKFFSIISHDLKNPFNTLLGASEMLSSEFDEMCEEDKKALVTIISNDVKKLYELLENLLFWASSQIGSLTANKIIICLHDLVSDVVSLYKSSASKKGIEIEVKIPREYFVKFDEFMLSTIIRNLLSNAIKFSNANGKILLTATEKDNKISFSISDNGVGMSEENIRTLFNENLYLQTLGTDNEKGTGLGLMLCYDFAQKNNATINVTSRIGEGTTFELFFERANKGN